MEAPCTDEPGSLQALPDSNCLFELAAHCLATRSVACKLAWTEQIHTAWQVGCLHRETVIQVAPIADPGRPERPRLVASRDVPHRKLGTVVGRAALLHAVVHIEFNAIQLAWDAVYRFRDMPEAYYHDWVQIARDEVRHFRLLSQRLAELGYAYGDFDAHHGLWEMAVKTAASCRLRMALVPRVLEARGLDVTPGMITRLHTVGDMKTAAILGLILDEEVAHVGAGSRWFRFTCEREGLVPETTFQALLAEYLPGGLKGPFNIEARRQAGFTDKELARLGSTPA